MPSIRMGAVCEDLEQRVLLSTITWTNRGTTDNFAALVNDPGAAHCRTIVDRAISDWEQIVTDFNYSGGGNTYNVTFTIADLGADSRGSTDLLTHNNGKPTSADIELDDDGGGDGWYYDLAPGTSTIPDDGEFTTLNTRFAGDNGVNDYDFYRTAFHELGHAMGISGWTSLDVWDNLVDTGFNDWAGNDLYSYNIGGGAIEATFVVVGGLHTYETTIPGQPQYPSHAFDFMNAGRAIDTGERRLASDIVVQVLQDAYAYTVTLPSQLNTLLANLNTTSNVLTVSGDPGTVNDTITIDVSGTDIRVQVNGTSELIPIAEVDTITVNGGGGNDYIYIDELPTGAPVTVNAGDGNDVISITSAAGHLEYVASNVRVNGDAGSDTLNLQDLSHVGNETYTITSSTITRTNITYTVSYGTTLETIFVQGEDGNSIFNINSTSSSTHMTVNGQDGNDTFNVGNGDLDNYINGTLTLAGGIGADTIILDDTADTLNDTYTITGSTVSKLGMGTITYSTVEGLTLNANAYNNTIYLDGSTSLTPVTINAGDGNDTINLGAGDWDSNVFGDVTVNGGAGTDSLNLDDTSDTVNDSYTITNSTAFKASGGTITYATVEGLVLDANTYNNTININSTSSLVPVTVNAGAGNDTINAGTGDLDSTIFATVTVNGGEGSDTLILDDSTDAVGNDTYTITSTTFDKTGFPLLTYATVEGLTLSASPLDNTIDINSTATGTPVTVNAADGADTFRVNAPPSSTVRLYGGNPPASPGDGLLVTGTASSTGTYTPSSAGPGAGTVVYDGISIIFYELESPTAAVDVNTFQTFTFRTPLNQDVIHVDSLSAEGKNIISGTSDGVAMTRLLFRDVTNFVLNTGANDKSAPDDTIWVHYLGLLAAGLADFRLIAGWGNDVLNVEYGTFTFNRDAYPDTSNLTVNVLGGQVLFNTTQHLAGLYIARGASATLAAGADKILVSKTLTIEGGATPLGKLDLKNNRMVLNYTGASPLLTIKDQIKYAWNSGAWNRNGITTSLGNAATYALGYAEASVLLGPGGGTFGTEPVDGTSVLLRYTFYGDATLDGIVDIVDLGKVGTNWQSAGWWTEGDFNYDGFIDIVDLGIVGTNWQMSLPPATPSTAPVPPTVFSDLPIGKKRRPGQNR